MKTLVNNHINEGFIFYSNPYFTKYKINQYPLYSLNDKPRILYVLYKSKYCCPFIELSHIDWNYVLQSLVLAYVFLIFLIDCTFQLALLKIHYIPIGSIL